MIRRAGRGRWDVPGAFLPSVPGRARNADPRIKTPPGIRVYRAVYAEGTLLYENGVYVFEAEVIKTSCPSKYEEEAAADE